MHPHLLLQQSCFLWLKAVQAEQRLRPLQSLYMEQTLIEVVMGLHDLSSSDCSGTCCAH